MTVYSMAVPDLQYDPPIFTPHMGVNTQKHMLWIKWAEICYPGVFRGADHESDIYFTKGPL